MQLTFETIKILLSHKQSAKVLAEIDVDEVS